MRLLLSVGLWAVLLTAGVRAETFTLSPYPIFDGSLSQSFAIDISHEDPAFGNSNVRVGMTAGGYFENCAFWFFKFTNEQVPVTSATLRVPRGSYHSSASSVEVKFNYMLFPVNGMFDHLKPLNVFDAAVYGPSIGSITVTPGPATDMLDVPLPQSILDLLNAKPAMTSDTTYYVSFGARLAVRDADSLVLQTQLPAQLVMTTVPEPGTWGLCVLAVPLLRLCSLGTSRRASPRRKRPES